ETLGTLEEALSLEILISIIVVIILVMNLRASFLISSLLPIGVLMTFIVMRNFGVDANIVALSGIAIAIGVMVDVGVVFTENIVRHLDEPENKGARGQKLTSVIYTAATEVAPAVITALTTTVVSFLPVFAMEAAEGKLFRPLAFTKTFAMISAFIIGILFIPALANLVFSIRFDRKKTRIFWNSLLIAGSIALMILSGSWIAIILILVGINNLLEFLWKEDQKKYTNYINIALTLIVVVYYLTHLWMPMGTQNSFLINFLFVAAIIVVVLGILMSVVHYYKSILNWALNNKWKFLSIPIFFIVLGITTWTGFNNIFGFVNKGFNVAGIDLKETSGWKALSSTFPGFGKEFMPTLDEGSFLLMPTTMPHSGVQENIEVIRMLDLKVNSIPEVESVVGKWGRVNSALDPAPISMYENVINYKPEFMLDEKGHRIRFKMDKEGKYVLRNGGAFDPETGNLSSISKQDLVEDKNGEYFRQWRKHINSPDDIWQEIVKNSKIPGLTSAPKLQPIQTRLVMLQTGMRAPMGIKVYGPDLESIEKTGMAIENILREVEGVQAASVFADRVVGKPYLELKIKRDVIARYGLTIKGLQTVLSSAIGGMTLSTTVEGRERFPIRVRYAREYRDDPESLKAILIPTPAGAQVPLGELVDVIYTRGPQLIKSEDTFLVGYVIFDKLKNYAEVDVVENAQKVLNEKIDRGELIIPKGVTYRFTGNYENQERATKRLLIVIPLSLIVIFLILYFQFRSVVVSSMVFTGIFVAFAGGFLMIWLYGQGWFMNFSLSGINMRDLFQMHTINMSVAVWVGFIALFGIATDDGVIMGTYLNQVFDKRMPQTRNDVRNAVIEAGSKRVRPAMMTAATTIIALIPVLTSTGKGSDIMVP
ncbi:MAG: cation transporter, partial [Bacteroidetes bacterium]